MSFKPRKTTIVALVHHGPADGWYIYHDFKRYGPWDGFREDGANWDIWDVHDWAVEHLGVCPFPTQPCDESHKRSERAEKLRDEQRKRGQQLSFA